ncbi:hypothetical protein EMPS_07888 [Entomortierella parvispora]|uniref:Uncharacterized protein n=1 Tax=Entomortierella parvispora TaxID=205924 RepID=A0A9P3HFC3_9FUNG|nr:hypothetical protein EMPS_07888 [Entomortierella parvispora]
MTKRDGKNGKYTRVPERDNHSDDASPSTQPPPYSPSADRPSPSFVHPHHAPMSHDSPSEPLFRPPVQHVNQLLQYQSPQAHQSQLQQHHQPGYQYNEPQHQVLRNVTTSGLMVSPLILTRPPTKVEELKSKPGLVVCQHCRHLVYTETYLENGIYSTLSLPLLL